MSRRAHDERQISGQWHDHSTGLVERYELSLRGAHGVVVRQHAAGGGYAACIDDEGRQQWADQQFDDVQNAQVWCERALSVRTSNEGYDDLPMEDACHRGTAGLSQSAGRSEGIVGG